MEKTGFHNLGSSRQGASEWEHEDDLVNPEFALIYERLVPAFGMPWITKWLARGQVQVLLDESVLQPVLQAFLGTRSLLHELNEPQEGRGVAHYLIFIPGNIHSRTEYDWPEALRSYGRLQEIPEQRLGSQRRIVEFEDRVRHLHDLLVELGRNIEDTDQRLASGVRVKRTLHEVLSAATDQELRRHRELTTLMLDAVRHVPSENLSVRHLSALEECTDRLSATELTHEDLAVCDVALLAAGLDSLPDLGDEVE